MQKIIYTKSWLAIFMAKKSVALAYLTIILCIWPINVCLAQDPSEMISFLFGGEAEALVEGAQLFGETIIKGHNCDEAVNSYNDAKYYYEHGQYILALKAINESTNCWESAGFFSEYDIVYTIGPDDSWGLKGEILNKISRWEEAIDCCNNALDLNYENAYAWAIMGDAFFNLKLYQKSIECYDSVITIDSSYGYAYLRKLDAQKALEDNTHSKDETTVTMYSLPESTTIRIEGGTGYGGSSFSMNNQYMPNSNTGSEDVVSESRTVDTFNSIKLILPGNLYLTQDTQQRLIVEGEGNILKMLTTNVVDDQLIIKTEGFTSPTKPVNVYVSTGDIKKLNIISGNIIGQSLIRSDTLEVDITGSGSSNLNLNVRELDTSISSSGCLNLKGTANVHNSALSGSGNINAFELMTKTTNLNVLGSGIAQVYAFGKLNIKMTGSGIVYYKGDADVSKSITGTGNIKKV